MVPDASVAVEYLLQSRRGVRMAGLLESDDLVAPHLLDAEVLSVLRRQVLRGELDEPSAQFALQALAAWPIERVPHTPLLQAAFDLRFNYSAYDALYVAVAQRLAATVVTCDGPLSRAPAVPGVVIRNIG